MPSDLALSSTHTGSNYPCLELVFMVPKVFEPLKFDCIYIYIYIYRERERERYNKSTMPENAEKYFYGPTGI